MQEFKPQSSGFNTLNQELNSRSNHCFSETEVKDFLQQTLSQLRWLHSQNKCHGSINIDSFAFHEEQVRLLESDTESQLFAGQRQDIVSLGIVTLQMLTGLPVEKLRDSYGSWSWEESCFISDQLTVLLNRMIGNSPQPPLSSVDEVLRELQNLDKVSIDNSDAPSIVIPSPPTEFSSVQPASFTSQPPYPEYQNSRNGFKLKLWHWIVLGIVCGGSAVALILPSFMSKAKEAKESAAVSYLGTINRQQQAFYIENEEFPTSLQDLNLNSPGINVSKVNDVNITDIYKFSLAQLDEVSVVATAEAREKGLKSYSLIMFLVQSDEDSISNASATCQTLESSQSAPQWPQLLPQAVACPPGSEILGNGFSGGDILLEPIPEEPEIPPPPVRLTQESALGVLSRWQRAKQAAYEPPYDTEPMREVLAGVILEGQNGNGGRLRSVSNLRASGSYYRYNQRSVTPIPGTFYSDEYRAEITVDVNERGDLYNSSGQRSSQGSFDSVYRVTYFFEKRPDASGTDRWFIVRCAGPASCRAD